jgi:hypothetical protein
LQVSNETTLFMQKAIYYVSKPIAARGILELTDRRLCFQVQSFDASFGIKNLSIDVCMISNVSIVHGDLHPKVVVTSGEKKHEFVLSKGQELYERLKELQKNPLGQSNDGAFAREVVCECGKSVSGAYRYCPWCGSKLTAA